MKILVIIILLQSPQDSVLVPIENLRRANEMFLELYYLRSKEEFCQVNTKLQLQQLSVVEHREKECITLVQKYEQYETQPKPKLKWWQAVGIGFLIGLTIK